MVAWLGLYWPIYGTLGTNTPSQYGPVSSGNEGVLHIPQSSRIEAVYCHTQDTKADGVERKKERKKERKTWTNIRKERWSRHKKERKVEQKERRNRKKDGIDI